MTFSLLPCLIFFSSSLYLLLPLYLIPVCAFDKESECRSSWRINSNDTHCVFYVLNTKATDIWTKRTRFTSRVPPGPPLSLSEYPPLPETAMWVSSFRYRSSDQNQPWMAILTTFPNASIDIVVPFDWQCRLHPKWTLSFFFYLNLVSWKI